MAPELLDAPKTEIAKPQPINWELLREQALASFDIQSEAIANEVAADTQLKVTDDNTRKAAKERHWVWVKRRTALTKTRKEASEDAKKIVDLVKEVATSFQTEFSKAEDHLAAQIEAYDAEIERKKQEAIEAIFKAKNDRLVAAGVILPRLRVDSMTDIEIDDMISEAEELARFRKVQAEREAAEKAEAERLAAEEKERNRIEAEKLAKERAEFERQQAEMTAERDRLAKIEAENLAAERKKLDEERAEVERLRREQAEREAEAQRKIEEEKSRLEKAEADRLAEIERQRLEAERVERERVEAELKATREAALRPDKEKLLAFADRVGELSEHIPQVADDLRVVTEWAECALLECCQKIREMVA